MFLHVWGFSFTMMLNLNISSSTLHNRPKALSIGNLSLSKSSSLTSQARSSFGMCSRMVQLLLIHLVRWNPPFWQRDVSSLTSCTASCSDGRDLRQSSTLKLLTTVLIMLGWNMPLLSLAVRLSAKFAQLGDYTAPKRCTNMRCSTGDWLVSPLGHQRNLK